MDAVKFIEERNRMCKSFGERCKGCPGFDAYKEALCLVDRESTLDATAQVAIVEEWSTAHPRKTRQSEFLKIYPEAQINKKYGFIEICPADLMTNFRDDTGHCSRKDIDCTNCRREFWTQEVE